MGEPRLKGKKSPLIPVDYQIVEPDFNTHVSNQREQGCCLAIATADVVSMIMRISGKDKRALVSPQPLIDANATTVAKLQRFTMEIGLESEETYPFTRVPRDWDESLYRIRTNKRYRLDGYSYIDFPGKIKRLIAQNFGKNGKKYPILGAMYIGVFHDSLVARKCIEKKKPFMSDVVKEGSQEHALVIVGCNTLSSEPTDHYCYVKNSYGKDWGMKGISLIRFDVLNYIFVPKYEKKDEFEEKKESVQKEEEESAKKKEESVQKEEEESVKKKEESVQKEEEESVPVPPHNTEVYVALPANITNIECKVNDPSVLETTLFKVIGARADGVSVKVIWGIVENKAPKEYIWDGYERVFECLKNWRLKIEVVICLCEVEEGNFSVPLPSWIQKISKKDEEIFFKDNNKKSNSECLSWGIDEKKVLEGHSALEVYTDLMTSFQRTFKMLLQDGVIKIIELGLGPQGELRYPSCCVKRGWKYPGVGAFQCYDKYMLESFKNAAAKDQYRSFDIPKISCSYISEPTSCEFFSEKEIFDSLKSRYFLNWYAQKLVTHGKQVISSARSIFGNKIDMNVKLTGVHWWYTHTGQSHASELTSGFFTSCQHEGYDTVLRMLKAHKVGLKFAVDESYGSHSTQSTKNPDELLWEIRSAAASMATHSDFSDDDKSPLALSTWNVVPCNDKTSYRLVFEKALSDKKKATYRSFTYYGLGPLIEAPQEFAKFISKMHYSHMKVYAKRGKPDMHCKSSDMVYAKRSRRDK